MPVAAEPLRDDLAREGIELLGRHVVIRDSDVPKLQDALGRVPYKLRPCLRPVALGVANGGVVPEHHVPGHALEIKETPVADEILCALLQLTRRSLWLTCYGPDLPAGVAVLASLLGKSVGVRLLLCEGQKGPSGSSQHAIWKLSGVV